MNALHSPWMAALGWALLHSLWQGLLVGLGTWAALRLLQRRPAHVRCHIAGGGLLLMGLLILGTFALLMSPGSAPSGLGVRPPPTLQARLEAWMPYGTVAWFAGVAVMGTRLGLAWGWLLRLRTHGAEPAEPAWQARLEVLAGRLGLRRPVRLLRSSRVTTPMVLGWIRPLVLVPASAFLGLSPQALEAVLAHELAHVRRLDYLFNLLQNVLETLLFYHPAAWWLSRQIRQEREHAADDLAIALVGDPLPYARALADLEALRSLPLTPLQLAPAAHGGSLMQRIRRILLPPAPPLPSARAGLLTALAVATLGTGAAVAYAEDAASKESRRMVLQEGGRRVELQLKGDAQLDPKSDTGIRLGKDGAVELTVREAPVRKKVTLRKDEKGVAQVITENGLERPLQAADEAWLKQALEPLKELEAKAAQGKAGTRTFRVELQEDGPKGGSPRTFTYRVGPAQEGACLDGFTAPSGGLLHDLDPELKARLRDLPHRIHIEARGLPGHEQVLKHIEEIRERFGDEPSKHIVIQTHPGADEKAGPTVRKQIRIETKKGEGKEGRPRVIIHDGDKVLEHDLDGAHPIILGDLEGIRHFGDPKREAEQVKRQIERLQKRLKDLEAKAASQPEPKK